LRVLALTKADGSEADLCSARDASSFIEVVLAIFILGSDSNAAAHRFEPCPQPLQ
jgi:hypothetical protein